MGQLDWGVGMFSKGFSIAVVGSFIEIALLLGVTLKNVKTVGGGGSWNLITAFVKWHKNQRQRIFDEIMQVF